MTSKQRLLKICEKEGITIDSLVGVGLSIDLVAPKGYCFQSGIHAICSSTYYTCRYEIWEDLLERIQNELPLVKCSCEDCQK